MLLVPGSDAERDELLRGQMSPVSGCSSGDDLMGYPEPVGLPQRHSTPNIHLDALADGTVRPGERAIGHGISLAEE